MEFSWHDPGRLIYEVRTRPRLDQDALVRADSDFLIDTWIPGAPLLISFAFVDWEKRADFYLFGRSKKLEAMRGQEFNRILLRDPKNQWYLHGVPGLGDSVSQVVERLQMLIACLLPSAVWCIGESMGGYAAIRHGILLRADRIISFGALSTFSPAFAEQYGERRWLPVMKALDPALTEDSDLPALARQHDYRGKLHLVAGTLGGLNAPEAVNLDVMHGQRFADLPGVHYHYYRDAQHTVTHWLVQQKRFDELLMHCLFDARDPTRLEKLPAPGRTIGAPALFNWPNRFPTLDADAIAAANSNPDIDVVAHAITPGTPLVICFADAAPPGMPSHFEPYPQCLQLQGVTGNAWNRILLRDSGGQAWLRGCRGLGESAASVAANLRKLIARMQPSRIVCVGRGIGGYAALMFGEMLGADAMLAFNPLTLLDFRLAELWHDDRYRHVLSAIEKTPPAAGPRDLLPLLRSFRGKVHIVCAVRPPCGETSTDYDAGSQESVNAQRVAMLPNVEVEPENADDRQTLTARASAMLAELMVDESLHHVPVETKVDVTAHTNENFGDLNQRASAKDIANYFKPASAVLPAFGIANDAAKLEFLVDFSHGINVGKNSGKS